MRNLFWLTLLVSGSLFAQAPPVDWKEVVFNAVPCYGNTFCNTLTITAYNKADQVLYTSSILTKSQYSTSSVTLFTEEGKIVIRSKQ